MDYDPDDTATIPRLRQPVSVLRAGLNADRLAHAAVAPHPVVSLQNATNDPYRDLTSVRHVYGSAMAMRLATERSVATQQSMQLGMHGRAVGPTSTTLSSSLYGEITQGRDVDLQFEDYLGLPQDRPDHGGNGTGGSGAHSLLPHVAMERQLGME